MKRAHLGDNIDFWKRGLLGYLRAAAGIDRLWDNEADENVIESVTLTFDFFELIQ